MTNRLTARCSHTPSASRPVTKLDRIINVLMTRPEGLNRFEAEQYGEHCLNSTIAEIRSMYGNKLVQRWEVVPTRYSPNGVRCCRYWLTGGGSQ